MPPNRPPTEQEIWEITRRTMDIIKSNITFHVCLFGSAAVSLWADIDRVPHDIDIVVSERYLEESEAEEIAEDIKETIIRADRGFYLEQSKILGKTYRILYCRLPGWFFDESRRVKVDILVPPILNLPPISVFETLFIDNIPVMPIFDLLVMKTQGWRDHRVSLRADFRAKESADVSDIIALLERAKQQNVSYVDEANKDRHSPKFMSHADTLASEFVLVYRRPRPWRALRFPLYEVVLAINSPV